MWALPAGGGIVKAAKRAAVEQRGARRVTPAALPTPVLVIQEIQTSWTKASRGAPGSVARQTVPHAVLSGPAEDIHSFDRSVLEALGLGGKGVVHSSLGLGHRGEAAGGEIMLLGVVPDRFDSREVGAVGR